MAQRTGRATVLAAIGAFPATRVLVVGLAVAALTGAAPARATDLAAEARRLVGAGQGVHVETEAGRVLVSEAGARAVHPASVSKIPTTLALLRKLGPDYRFETRFFADGPVADGLLSGPLVVEGRGDPYFVDENALLVVEALRRAGVRQVKGELLVEGRLLFNWKADGLSARIRRALDGGTPPAAWQAVRARVASAGAVAPRLEFLRPPLAGHGAPALLATHRSQPLRFMLKALNGYSNNIFAPFAEAAGGIADVERVVRRDLPADWRGELVLGDGAGAHPRNRMSPRATVRILRSLSGELAPHSLDLADVMPVAGVDEGTLKKRLDRPGERGVVVAKTGTYGDYGACALAGALRTKQHGVVYFAILNRGVPIEEGRRRQDAFLRALMKALGAEPWPYRRDDAPAFSRAEIVVASAAPAEPALRRAATSRPGR